MQHIATEVQTISTALFSSLESYNPSADLGVWGYSKTTFPGGYLETLEGTFSVSNIASIPAGYEVFLNFRVCATQIAGWDQTIMSENTRAYMHRPDFSHSKELGEQNPQLDGVWSKRTLQDIVVWAVRDSVFILDNWFDQPEDMSDEDYAAEMAQYKF